MTKDQARIVLLEQALEQAQSTTEFLHGCLTEDNYTYAYPEMTLQNLKEWEALAPRHTPCVHSFTDANCSSCLDRIRKQELREQAQKVLA